MTTVYDTLYCCAQGYYSQFLWMLVLLPALFIVVMFTIGAIRVVRHRPDADLSWWIERGALFSFFLGFLLIAINLLHMGKHIGVTMDCVELVYSFCSNGVVLAWTSSVALSGMILAMILRALSCCRPN